MSSDRLYAKATFMGFKRGKTTQHEQQSIVKIEGLSSRKEVQFYLGKRVCYRYFGKAGKKSKCDVEGGKQPERLRVIWGKIIAPHGNSGAVRAKFAKNLPPCAMGKQLSVMMYPSNI